MLLQTLAFLGILVQIPVWLLIIFLPQHDWTRKVTSNYLVFVLMGIFYIFVMIGLFSYGFSLNSTFSAALASIPADAKGITADSLKPLSAALTTAQNSLPLLAAVVSLCSYMDLAGGFIAYRELTQRGTARATHTVLMLLVFVLGPAGFMIYALWHWLTIDSKVEPAA